ncbi:hypothetical protein LCGC14_0363530 [marine sediment metagenome]|uniref:Lipoprotein n=1 Tax=marine sediment metagenome TaxID=412755 RepID=A0A0F9VUK1_9ZZZZ
MKKLLIILFISLIILLSGCELIYGGCPQCYCPEKVCPSCPKCEDIKPKDKLLIVEFRGWKVYDSYEGKAGNAYAILNPNDRKVLAEIETHCYDEDKNEIPSSDKWKVFIDAKSEAFNGRYWYTNCLDRSMGTVVTAKIID